MKLRYLTRRNYVNAEQVRVYALEQQLSMTGAKNILEAKLGPTLQYEEDGVWKDVVHIDEYRT